MIDWFGVNSAAVFYSENVFYSKAAINLKLSFSSVSVPVLSKQIVRTIPQMLIFSGVMQNTWFFRNRFNEKLTPNERHVGNAGGTEIVIKSKHRMITSFVSMSPKSSLSKNVESETKNEIKATEPRIKMNLPESFLNEI